ncbi:MAG: hypothetical protein ACYC7D_10315 [Nitrososphaerales archaeon]
MSFSEIALAVGGVAIGLGSGSIIAYFYFNGLKKNPRQSIHLDTVKAEDESLVDVPTSLPTPSTGPRMVPVSILERSKRELRTLLLEKELVSAALTRLYEAEVAKEITREERETLGTKYRDELKSLDERILKIDAFIEVGDLETLRDQLVRLVNQKMDAIDRRIEHTKKAAAPLIAEMIKPRESPLRQQTEAKPRIPDISDMLAPDSSPLTSEYPRQNIEAVPLVSENLSPDPRIRRRPPEAQDNQAEQLQKELLEALDRLEKLDIES